MPNLLSGETVCLDNGADHREIDAAKLPDVASHTVLALGAIDAEQTDPGTRVPAGERWLAEQQEGGVGDAPSARADR